MTNFISHLVPYSAIKGWAFPNSLRACVPIGISIHCPHCSERWGMQLQFERWRQSKAYEQEVFCPSTACNGRVEFMIVRPSTGDVNEAHNAGAPVLMFPSGGNARLPMPGHELLPDRVRKYYLDIFDIYATRKWSPIANCVRVALEGLVKSQIPKAELKSDLFDNIKILPKYVALGPELENVAHSIRRGGNFGSHFNEDEDHEPNEEIVTMMIDLLDSLIERIFILPRRAQELHDKIEQLDRRRKGPGGATP